MRRAPRRFPRAKRSHSRAPQLALREHLTSPQFQWTHPSTRCPRQSPRRASRPRQTLPALSKCKCRSNSPHSNRESRPTLRRLPSRLVSPQPLPPAPHALPSTPQYPRCLACSSLPACIFAHAHYHGEVPNGVSNVPETPPIAESIGPIFHAQRLRVEWHFRRVRHSTQP